MTIRAAAPAPKKIQAVDALDETFQKSESIILADFTGMSVAEFDRLRRSCFKNNITFHVIKNTLARLVFERHGHNVTEILNGPTGFCFGFDDPIVPVRIIADFIKDNKKPVIKGCFIEGQMYGPDKVEELRDIPPRDVLLALVLGAIISPLSGFVFTLNEIVRSFVGVIDALAQKAEADGVQREGLSAVGGSVEQLLETIEKMTVLELVQFKKALEEKFGVTAAAPMAMGGMMGGGAAPAAVEEVEEQTEFTIILSSSGDKKIQVIKEIRAITGLGLKEAKALVDEAPKPIKEGISKEEAMEIKAKVEEAGGSVEIK